MPGQVGLAMTMNDPEGRCLDGMVRNATAIRERFAAVALNATDRTAPDLLAVAAETLGALVEVHAPGAGVIGRARRRAVEMCLDSDADFILYSDYDHLLRWVESAPDEIDAVLAEPAVDVVVIGRSASAMERSPARLRETERLVNHTYGLVAGAPDADTMAAVRLLSRRAAELIVAECREDTIGNDVAWPLLCRSRGLRVAHRQVDGWTYRTWQDFDTAADERDGDPIEWIKRLEIAATHAAAMRPYIET